MLSNLLGLPRPVDLKMIVETRGFSGSIDLARASKKLFGIDEIKKA